MEREYTLKEQNLFTILPHKQLLIHQDTRQGLGNWFLLTAPTGAEAGFICREPTGIWAVTVVMFTSQNWEIRDFPKCFCPANQITGSFWFFLLLGTGIMFWGTIVA